MFCTYVHLCSTSTRHSRQHEEEDEISTALSLLKSTLQSISWKSLESQIFKNDALPMTLPTLHTYFLYQDNIQGTL